VGQHPRKKKAHQGWFWRKNAEARKQGRTNRQGFEKVCEENPLKKEVNHANGQR
jgi:hypothetical protein